jgi:hypothetical protein
MQIEDETVIREEKVLEKEYFDSGAARQESKSTEKTYLSNMSGISKGPTGDVSGNWRYSSLKSSDNDGVLSQ